MIYTINDKKYLSGERDTHPTSLSIIKLQKIHLEAHFSYRSNLLENDTLFLVASGCIVCGKETFESGHMIYLPRYLGFQFDAATPTELIEIAFDYSERLLFSHEKIYVIKAPLDILEFCNQIYRNNSFYNNLPGVNEGLLLSILNTLNILYSSYSHELSLYQKCHDWVAQNAFHPITAESVAEAMGCTVAHLNRTVKKYSGKCLSTMISEARISATKQLIKFTNCSTQELACKLGFDSPELLRKFFKYHTGSSLTEYKKSTL